MSFNFRSIDKRCQQMTSESDEIKLLKIFISLFASLDGDTCRKHAPLCCTLALDVPTSLNNLLNKCL